MIYDWYNKQTMGCHVSKPKHDSHTPETWIEYGRRMDLELAEGLNEKRKYVLREHECLTAGDMSIDDKVHCLIIETDIRVVAFSRWALNNMRFSTTHNASKDNKIIARCMEPFWMASVPGDVMWRGIKDEEPNAVITRAIELGWEPVKTRLNRTLAPSVVSDCGAITWNIVQ
jgi:hypothetical protein